MRGSNHLAVFHIDKDGKLTLIQRKDSGGEIPREFILSPGGRYLLAGHQDTDTICVFEIDQDTGELTLVHTEKEVNCVTVLAPWKN